MPLLVLHIHTHIIVIQKMMEVRAGKPYNSTTLPTFKQEWGIICDTTGTSMQCRLSVKEWTDGLARLISRIALLFYIFNFSSFCSTFPLYCWISTAVSFFIAQCLNYSFLLSFYGMKQTTNLFGTFSRLSSPIAKSWRLTLLKHKVMVRVGTAYCHLCFEYLNAVF